MALNYTVHIYAQPVFGNLPHGPSVPPQDGQVLALNTNSDAITGPCELVMVPDEKVRLDVKQTTGALDPATSPLVLLANLERRFSVGPGIWYVKATAFA